MSDNANRVAKYNLGDIVKLNAGGPDMTVGAVNTNLHDEFNGTYRCQWFAGKKLDSGTFREESLVLVKKLGK